MLSTVSIYQSGDSTAIDAEIVLYEAVNGAGLLGPVTRNDNTEATYGTN